MTARPNGSNRYTRGNPRNAETYQSTRRRSSAVSYGSQTRKSAPQTRRSPSYSSANRRVVYEKSTRTSHAARSSSNKFVSAISLLWNKSRVLFFLIICLLLIMLGAGIDYAFTHDRIYKGVTIGDVDVSDMTISDAADAVATRYMHNLTSTTAFIFENEEVAESVDIDKLIVEEDALAEQISFEEAQSKKSMWAADAASLSAFIPSDDLVSEAFEIGRGGNIFERLSAQISGKNIPVRLNYDNAKLSGLLDNINNKLGDPRVDWGMKVEDGYASVTEGHDGNMVDRDKFAEELTAKLLEDDSPRVTMVANIEYAPILIDQSAAQRTCDAVNSALSGKTSFTYDGISVPLESKTVGEWITGTPKQRADVYYLDPGIDDSKATAAIASLLNREETGDGIAVSFNVSGDEVSVSTDSPIVLPSVDKAAEALDYELFHKYRELDSTDAPESEIQIPITTETVSGPFPFKEALDRGIIDQISLYTTKYNDTASTQNRKFNIHKVADSFQNTVIARNGGDWSFNRYAGSCDKAAGYKDANAIIEGEIVPESGGGICQVATTVFNAVYESGFPVKERHPHSLRMRSYPDGRDAAIAYPTLDLIWNNDSPSDVLMRTSYTDTTVSVALYGISPKYKVKTDTGDWQEDKEFKVKVKVDEDKPKGYKKVETAGADGMKIDVVRTVTDENGNLVRKDTFTSVYSPVDKVIVIGPGTEVDKEAEAQKST